MPEIALSVYIPKQWLITSSISCHVTPRGTRQPLQVQVRGGVLSQMMLQSTRR